MPRTNRARAAVLCATIVLAAAPQALAEPELADTQWILDGAAVVEFDIARDELHSLHRPSPQAVVRIASLASAEQVRQYAHWFNAANHEPMELTLYVRGRPRNEWSRRFLTRELLVRLSATADPRAIEARALTTLEPLPSLPSGWFIAHTHEVAGALRLAQRLRRDRDVLLAEPQLAKSHQKKLVPNDPFFYSQWHLLNTGQNGGVPGIDVGVTSVWNTYRGAGVVIGVVDDGLQLLHV